MWQLRAERLWVASLVVLLGTPLLAHAQTTRGLGDEYSKQIKTAEVVGALGNDLFGEQTNLYTGTTEFVVTDLSIPSNSGLPVEIRRRFVVQDRDGYEFQGAFGDWELDIPYLYGVFAEETFPGAVGWRVNTSTPDARCSVTDYNYAVPPDEPADGAASGYYFFADEYWAGNSMHIPAGGDQVMLVRTSDNTQQPTDGTSYYWTTSDRWYFSCLSTTANGIAGESFVAHSPDGRKYRFDYFVKRNASSLRKSMGSARAAGGMQTMSANEANLRRDEVRILPTRVEDRFGNWVQYTYDPSVTGRLTQIHANDGRQISISYNAAGDIASVSHGSRTWTYGYDAEGALATVTLPDASQWTYSLAWLRTVSINYPDEGATCESPDGQVGGGAGEGASGVMTHPSGAIGEFWFRWQRHGRSYVYKDCFEGGTQLRYSVIPQTFDVPALYKKQLRGAGLTTATWTHLYSVPAGSWAQNCPTPTSCVRTKTLTVTGPESWVRYTFGTKTGEDEGKLLKTEWGDSETTILRSQVAAYQVSATGQAYPAFWGRDPNGRSDGMSQRAIPQRLSVTTQQGRAFNWQVDADCNGAMCFDSYARPTKVTKSSVPTP